MRKNFIKNKLVIGIVLLFIGASAVPTVLSQGIKKESASMMKAVIWVDDDGEDCPEPPADYDNIQEAIDNANIDDEIRICKGTYYENVIVDKSLILIGGWNGTSTIDGGGNGSVVTLTAVAPIEISGFTITNSGNKLQDIPPYEIDAGISADVKFGGHKITDNNIIKGNGKSGKGHGGIHLQRTIGIPFTSQPTIAHNCIMNNHGDGIKLEILSFFNNIHKNSIKNNNKNGVYLEFQADFNTIWENDFIGNKDNAYTVGSFVNTWRRNYWDDLENRSLPVYIIRGVVLGLIPWPFNVDLYPAESPYNYTCT